MTKILFIVNNLIIGGVEKVCWEIVSNLDRDEFQFDFLVAISQDTVQYYEPKLIELGANIYKGGYIFGSKAKRKFLEFERKVLCENQYDVVHSHVNFMNAWTLKVAEQERVPIRISHVHSTLPDGGSCDLAQKLKTMAQRYFLNRYSNVRLACSKQAGEDHYGNRVKFQVLFNGFDIQRFINSDRKHRSRYGLVTVGRIDDEKNPEFIVKIMKCLVEIDPRYHLHWIGDGAQRTECEKQIRDFDLTQSIEMVGATTDIIPYMEKSALALFPSKYEGLGIAIVETQLAHCYTYYSDIVPEEANIGFACPLSLMNSPKQWAKKIHEDVLEGNYEKKNIDISKASQHDAKHVKEMMEKIYKKGI